MVKEESNVVWNVSVGNPRLMELLSIFIGEKTLKLVQSLDPNNLEANQKIALESIKSLSKKLEKAQGDPLWNLEKFIGFLGQHGTNAMLYTRQGALLLTGSNAPQARGMAGRFVIAEGYVKAPWSFELTRLLEKRTNTLELFVMSHCPFGQRAETSLLNFLDRTNIATKPKLEVRYLFYKQRKDGKEVWTSLHGEDEIVENLVQMAIRDRFAPLFGFYLCARNTNLGSPWKQLAEQLGIAKPQIEEIENTIKTQREALIQNEYSYATGQYGIMDGSPTFIWESEKVRELQGVEAFQGYDGSSQEACAK
jgi:hypothetical protein